MQKKEDENDREERKRGEEREVVDVLASAGLVFLRVDDSGGVRVVWGVEPRSEGRSGRKEEKNTPAIQLDGKASRLERSPMERLESSTAPANRRTLPLRSAVSTNTQMQARPHN